DATTWQNAFEQAKTFHEAVGVDGLILSKYDSSGRGGIAVSICRELGLPFFYYGTGEKLQDLEPFDADRFVAGLLGEE
ncbi:MAG: signal recognition particle-docking protein FtsY, partial [Spirochaetales bacterium]|nr:signal recognition particle-docking protein FtsY [Spirochaetales bacterium]